MYVSASKIDPDAYTVMRVRVRV